jgi:DNA-binding MarR family transcriptional regulator
VQTLHKDGFLKIESDIEDKRKNMVSLTASGKFVCERIQALVIAFDSQVMEHFSEEERQAVYRLSGQGCIGHREIKKFKLIVDMSPVDVSTINKGLATTIK